MVLTFGVSLGAAFIVSFAIARMQRESRAKPALWPLAAGFACGIALACVLAALDLVGWGSVGVGVGMAIGMLTGQALGVARVGVRLRVRVGGTAQMSRNRDADL